MATHIWGIVSDSSHGPHICNVGTRRPLPGRILRPIECQVAGDAPRIERARPPCQEYSTLVLMWHVAGENAVGAEILEVHWEASAGVRSVIQLQNLGCLNSGLL
jgi:hypothetical protein